MPRRAILWSVTMGKYNRAGLTGHQIRGFRVTHKITKYVKIKFRVEVKSVSQVLNLSRDAQIKCCVLRMFGVNSSIFWLLPVYIGSWDSVSGRFLYQIPIWRSHRECLNVSEARVTHYGNILHETRRNMRWCTTQILVTSKCTQCMDGNNKNKPLLYSWGWGRRPE